MSEVLDRPLDQSIQPVKSTVNIGYRLLSMFLDHFIMSFSGVVFVLPFMLITIISDINRGSGEEPPPTLMQTLPIIGMGLLYVVYYNKDSLNGHGRGPAKRIFKHQVVVHKTGEPASSVRCVIRNTFIVLWPIEVIATLITPARRLGDRIAGTRVADYVKPDEKPELDWGMLVEWHPCGIADFGTSGYQRPHIDIRYS